MKRKKQKPQKQNALVRFKLLPVEQKRRLLLKSGLALGVMGVGAGVLAGYDSKQRTLHDLSTIGNGKPVVVQIHDTSCQICRRLKSRSSTVLNDFDDVEFRIADINSTKGRELQEKYRVQKTTLLLFNAEGKLVSRAYGLQSLEELEELFTRHFLSST